MPTTTAVADEINRRKGTARIDLCGVLPELRPRAADEGAVKPLIERAGIISSEVRSTGSSGFCNLIVTLSQEEIMNWTQSLVLAAAVLFAGLTLGKAQTATGTYSLATIGSVALIISPDGRFWTCRFVPDRMLCQVEALP